MHEEKDYISFILDLRVPDTYYSSSMTHILVLIITDPQTITSSSFDIGSLLLHGLQHRAYSNSCPLSRWCHPTISSSVIPFSCLKSFPPSGSFLMSQFFASGGQSIGASASVLPTNIQDWFPLGWTGSRLELFATPWTVSHQAPPSMGFSRQEYWNGLPFPSPGHLPDLGIEPRSPAL